MTALAVEQLSVRAGALGLLRGVSLALDAGRCLTLLGETGSGKSLLAEAIIGTLPRDLTPSGQIRIGTQTFPAADQAARRPLWGRAVAMLPQEPWLALDPLMRSRTQVADVFRFVRHDDRRLAIGKADAALHSLGLNGAGDRRVAQLSGGMAQRVAVAATRAAGAALLIADEPTKGLDRAMRDAVVALLAAERDAGRALLTITHDVGVARALGGDVAVLLDGRVIEHGPAAQVLAAPAHAYTRALLAAEPEAWPDRAPSSAGEIVLAGEALTKSFGTRRLFRHLSLALRAGEVVAATGPSGCGKTTLGNILLGLVPADAGMVRRRDGIARTRFQKLWQDPPAAFAPRVTIRVALSDLCRLHGIGWPRVQALMARLKLAPALLDRRPDQVSGGELQRFALLRALLLDPVFLFADEPTSRLDPITQAGTVALLAEVAAERAMAMLLVTHDPAIARKVAARAIALQPPPPG